MRIVLLESRKQRSRPVTQGVFSIGVHVAVIAGAVHVTARSVIPQPRIEKDTQMIFVEPIVEPSTPSPRSVTRAEIPGLPPALPALPVVIDVPNNIPSHELGPEWNPDQWRHPGTGVESAEPGGRLVAAAGPGAALTEEQVDQPVEPLYLPLPRYPQGLQQMGIGGRVMVRFVVDTIGNVEPDSWQVVSADHPAFAAAAREALLKARFRPARFRGSPVRQLVQQPVSFAVR